MQIENKIPTLEEILLGSLMHDIGKFMQRAEIPLSEQSNRIMDTICPKSQYNTYTHRHVVWTNEYFEKFLKSVPEDIDKNVAANLACFHHRPENDVYQHIITKADRYSSGERIEKDYEEEAGGNWDSFKKVRMIPIFSEINLTQDQDKTNEVSRTPKFRIELKKLIPDEETIFPKPVKDLDPQDGITLEKNYKALWESFITDLSKVPADDAGQYLVALQRLLEEYTWCIPSSTIDQPDVSLYDHSRTAAAIAVCLFKYHCDTKTLTLNAVKNDAEKKFLLVGGDLSGIQDFIFNIAFSGAKGAGKLLRARSFYIDLSVRASIFKILKTLDLPFICNFMDSGGRFYLLVPNTSDTIQKLDAVSQEIAEWFKKEFLGELSLNLTWDVALRGEDFKPAAFKDILENITREIDLKKLSKLKGTFIGKDSKWNSQSFRIDSLYEKFKDNSCSACGKRPAEKEIKSREDEEKMKFCEQCFNLKEIGESIPKINSLGFSYQPVHEKDKPVSIFFKNTSNPVYVYRNPGDQRASYFLIEYINEPEDTADGSILPIKYMANHIPKFRGDEDTDLCVRCNLDKNTCGVEREKDKVKTFMCIAAEDREFNDKRDGGVGAQMVAIVKADVDDLGLLFSEGLGDKLTISRYASFSRMLNLFFAGYMEKLCERSKNQSIYTVYSGGDDLFLVGPWETMISFTKQINDQFRKYTCKNKDIHLSAAVLPIKPKFPVRMAGHFADVELEMAKNEGKNRIRLFGTTEEWKDFPEFVNFAEWLMKRLRDEESGITPAFMYRLLKYHCMALNALSGKNIEDLKFHSHMSYDIARNIKRKGKEDEEKLMKLYDLKEKDHSLMMGLKIPVFWALYKQRGG